jgi:acetyl esterase/lipase
MRKIVSVILGCALGCATVSTAQSTTPPTTEPIEVAVPMPPPAQTIDLWPGTPPGDKPGLPAEKTVGNNLTNVSTPTIAVYPPPPDIDTGAAVLVCPGGGFRQLAFIKEGTNIAHWLNSVGITAIVLKYRVPARPDMPRFMAALQDAQRAICIIRSNAAQWHIDPHRLGMIGFSAGGQMVADVTTNYDKLAYPPIDAMDQQSTRPDFALAIYPGGIAAKDGTATVTPDVRPTKDTPMTFIAIATDDRNGPENAVYYYLALKKAGVNAELHVFSEGNHGFALRPTTAPHGAWPTLAVAWMNYHGFLKAPPATQP